MSSINSELLKLLGEITRKYSFETLKNTDFDSTVSMEEAERIWALGIQQLPDNRYKELKGKADEGLSVLKQNQVVLQLGIWGMVPKEQLEEQIADLPGDSSDVIHQMIIDGFVSTFNLEENGKFTEFVSLTGEGRALYEKRHARAEGLRDAFLAPLNEDERQQLFELLSKLV